MSSIAALEAYRPPAMPAADWEKLVAAGVPRSFADGQLICSPGDACKGWPLVVSGEIRLFTMSETGREMTLYRLGAGETCFLTVSCLLGDQVFPVYAAADGPTEVVLLSPRDFRQWFDSSAEWREHVCGSLTGRLVGVIATLQEVAFRRVDVRLAALLVDQAHEGAVAATHSELAADLGTSREVVSRILKELEHDGHVRLRRGHVVLVDPAALAMIGGI